MKSILELVTQGIEKSKALLLLADSEEWEKFTEQNAEREQILRQINLENLTLSEPDNRLLHSKMSELIALNKQLESVCITARSAAAAELTKIKLGNKVTKAYSQ